MNTPEDSPPRVALALASGFGLGYLPIAPGTWGSLGSLGLYLGLEQVIPPLGFFLGDGHAWIPGSLPFLAVFFGLNVALALVGAWAAGVSSRHLALRDPGAVVIDEISGQQLAFLALAPIGWRDLLLGFVLFRAFDIWKPFPARQAESWPGGWGIMADDWFAGLYAAVGLWLAKLLGW